MSELVFAPQAIGPSCLVIGGSGYLGGRLVQRLAASGCRVRCFDVTPYAGPARVESLVGDVRFYGDVRAACEGIDTVFHTAATIDLLARYRPERRRRVFDVNVLGTEHVLRACRAARVARLVQTSSINVAMGEAVRDGDETTRLVGPGDLLDLYSESKRLAECAVLAADSAQGLRSVALRPGGLWGPGQNSLMIVRFVEQLAAGRFKLLIGDGSRVLDNTHVENAVDAHLLAAQKLRETPEIVGGQAYFVTDAEPMNGLDWFRPLVEGLGHVWPRLRVPGWLMYRIADALEWNHFLRDSGAGPQPALTRRGVLNLIRDGSFCIEKARRDLGYRPRIQAAEGLPAVLPDAREIYARQLAALAEKGT
jgi:3beta-hydroxy-Delta5-steroid dehydrogenase / steroid Delta-isomerase